MPNRLANEISPYLLQHADNPVDWYPWGEEAFARARAEDKPVFLSIGYSACHWCHVMAHESFEDEQTATILNEHFVCIKVDREERPDVDAIYMKAVQAITGAGGWPMSVWLLPDGRPFFGGTYYPKAPRNGAPSFTQVLERVAHFFHENRAALEQDASHLTQAISQHIRLDGQETQMPGPDALEIAFQRVASGYDRANGGFGSQPKFPPAMTLEFLLRLYRRYGWQHALEMVTHTLDRMARGGMYDQIGGGFHRYSVDALWLIPHFEKMLYDNALLLRIYLHTYQATGESRYRRVVEEIVAYLQREMLDPAGGFYSSQDADSEGREGEFFVWSAEELRSALHGQVDVELVLDYWGVSAGPKFEGRNVLWVPDDPEKVAARHKIGVGALSAEVEKARALLFALREKRARPGRDDKILTAWNGLVINSLAQVARVLGREDVLELASRSADFILHTMRRDGRLMRSYRGGQPRHDACLEDYAFLAEALVELYQTTFDVRWFEEALALTDAMVALFWDDQVGFYDTAVDHDDLIVRPQELTDNAIPSGTSAAVAVLVRMSILADRPDWRDLAGRVFARLAAAVQEYPTAFSYLASQLEFVLSQPHEIALVGDPMSNDMQQLLAVIRQPYRPNQVVALQAPGENLAERIPLLAGRAMVGDRATAYVCRNFICRTPLTEPDLLRQELDGEQAV